MKEGSTIIFSVSFQFMGFQKDVWHGKGIVTFIKERWVTTGEQVCICAV